MKKGSKSSIVSASKEAERRVARAYPGGQRLSAGTWVGAGDIDVITPYYAIQVKHGYGLAAYISDGMKQAQEGAADTEEIMRVGGGFHGYGAEPILVIVTKPGRGHKSRMFEVREIHDA